MNSDKNLHWQNRVWVMWNQSSLNKKSRKEWWKKWNQWKDLKCMMKYQLETAHKRTLTMHWTALGWSVGKRRVKFAVDWLHADASKRTWTLTALSRLLLLLSLFASFFSCHCQDVGLFWPAISTAFLHAPMFERLFMRPPVEFYPESNCLWLLKRAMYGLKQAPALWQTHFAKTMISLGLHRCKTDPNLYCHSSIRNCMYCVMWMIFWYVETLNVETLSVSKFSLNNCQRRFCWRLKVNWNHKRQSTS